jgi:hypothetical protein
MPNATATTETEPPVELPAFSSHTPATSATSWTDGARACVATKATGEALRYNGVQRTIKKIHKPEARSVRLKILSLEVPHSALRVWRECSCPAFFGCPFSLLGRLNKRPQTSPWGAYTYVLRPKFAFVLGSEVKHRSWRTGAPALHCDAVGSTSSMIIGLACSHALSL